MPMSRSLDSDGFRLRHLSHTEARRQFSLTMHREPVARMKKYQRTAEAFCAAISFNPHFPEAHASLAGLLGKHLGDAETAREHRRMARLIWKRGAAGPALSRAQSADRQLFAAVSRAD